MVQAQVLDLLTSLVRDLGSGWSSSATTCRCSATTCDRLAVMYAGRVVEEGPSAEVLDRAQHPYTRALSAAFPTIGDQAARFAPRGLPGDPPWPGDLPGGLPVPPALPGGRATCAAPRTSRLRACRPAGTRRRASTSTAGTEAVA